MKLEWKTEKRRISELLPTEGNPRKMSEHDAAELKKSIERFNIVEIPAINTNNRILAGHMRIAALQALGRGEEEIEVRVPNRELTDEEAKEYLLRSNRNIGEWDWDLLANLDEDILKLSGFNQDELDSAFGLEMADDFDVDKEREKLLKGDKMRTKIGQVWKLGDHKLAVGDATDRSVWERLLGEETFDMLFTDPPYRLAYAKGRQFYKVKTKKGMVLKKNREYDAIGETDGKGKFNFGSKDNRSYEGVEIKGGVPEYDEWLGIAKDFQNTTANVMIFENWKNIHDLWEGVEKYWKIMNLVIWHIPNRMQGFTRADAFYNKYDIAIYGENGLVYENVDHEPEFEDYMAKKGQKLIESYDVALYGHSGGKSDVKAKGKKAKWGKVSDHVTAPVDSASASGQNIVFGSKPVQILAPYMKALSPRGGIVMEPYSGSGSTIVCCEMLKRKCRAIELSPLNSEVTLRRWEKYTGKKAELISDTNQ